MQNKELNYRHQTSTYLFSLFDMSCISLTLYLATSIYGVSINTSYLLALILALFSFYLTAQATNLYYAGLGSSMSRRIGLTIASTLIVFLVLVIAGSLTKTTGTYSRVTIGLWLTLMLTSLILWRVLYCKISTYQYKNRKNLKRVAIIGANNVGLDLRKAIETDFSLGYQFSGFFDDRNEWDERMVAFDPNCKITGNIEESIEKAKNNNIDVIYITLPLAAEKRIQFILNSLRNSAIAVHIIPNFFIYNILHARWHNIASYNALSIYDTPFYGVGSFVKRAEDIFLAFIITLFISLPMLLIAIAVKTTSKGPIIFKQKRYGINGKEVIIYKFRTMTVCDDGKTIKQAQENDVRITKLGNFLRKTSLDELPQFINVLQGNMSIVGPRPHAIAHNEEYRLKINGYMLRHIVKPGITGWAQINGYRGETKLIEQMEKRIEYDLQYIRGWSLPWDLKIIFLTVFKGFINKKAY